MNIACEILSEKCNASSKWMQELCNNKSNRIVREKTFEWLKAKAVILREFHCGFLYMDLYLLAWMIIEQLKDVPY